MDRYRGDCKPSVRRAIRAAIRLLAVHQSAHSGPNDTTMEWTPQMCHKLLEALEKHELLWNSRHPRYFDTLKKDDAWCIIAQVIGTEAEDCKRKVESLKS